MADAGPDFRALFEKAPALYLVLTPKLDIVAVSDLYCRAMMTTRAQILGRGIFDVFPAKPGDAATTLGNLRASFERVLLSRCPDALPVQKHDIALPAAEGGGFATRYWKPLNTPILDSRGDVVWIIHQVEDVTKLVRLQSEGTARGALMHRQQETIERGKLASGALEEQIEQNAMLERRVSERTSDLIASEEGFRLLVDSVKDHAIYQIDPAGNIVSWNVGAERIKGYKAEEILGQHMSRFYTEKDVASGKPRSELEVAAAEGRQVGEGLRVRKDGSVFHAAVTITAMYDESGRHVGFAKVTRDISEQKKMQELLERATQQLHQAQKMEAVGQLTGGIAHDFNNLLTVIIGNLDLLAERVARDETGLKLAQNALSAGLRGAELTRKLLAFSRIQALEKKAVDVNDLVRSMMDMLRRALGEKIEIAVSTAADLWLVETDVTQFESALVNLAVNARDAMPEGGRLTIETANRHFDERYAAENPGVAPGDYVMLAVTDTGTGIPPEHLDRVIEPFFTTKEVGKGSGLGLSMIYGFAKQSGGHLKIYSEVGHGTTARLYLPRGKAGVKTPIAPPAREAAPAGSGELILVVDDNDQVRSTVMAQLAELGYNALDAANGAAAIALLEARPGIDLLLTDIVMPGGMSGVQLGEAAKEIRPELRILYTSGFTEASIRNGTGKAIAGDQLLSKPYRKHELAREVHKALARKDNRASTAD